MKIHNTRGLVSTMFKRKNFKNTFDQYLLTKKSDIPKLREESKTPQANIHKQKTFLVISFNKKSDNSQKT